MKSAIAIVKNLPKNHTIYKANNFTKPYTENVNTVMYHAKHIQLKPVEVEKIHIAIQELELAKENVLSTLVVLNGFEGLSQREILLSGHHINANIYMLQELLRLSSPRPVAINSGLKPKGSYESR